MEKFYITVVILVVAFFTFTANFHTLSDPKDIGAPVYENTVGSYKEITGVIKSGETFYDIFKRYGLNMSDLFLMKKTCASIYRLKDITVDRPYKLEVDGQNRIYFFSYCINDDVSLSIIRKERGFIAKKIEVEYERKEGQIGGVINDNLIESIGESGERLLLALSLADIFACDIDFTTDMRKGDTFKIVVEELYQNNEFKRYGDIKAAEFVNDGKEYRAYRFEHNGNADYYDDEGKTLKRSFLKAPLSFRRISSLFSKRRLHPVLKIHRPHKGIDYAAPVGTPISAIGAGKVTFAGRKGSYGKIVMIRHYNGYKTYYGHLSRIGKGISPGVKVGQGEVIGYVGSTGLATGPHLHFEMRVNNKPINPIEVKVAKGKLLPKTVLAKFYVYRKQLSHKLASIIPETFMAAGDNRRETANGV
jgi:murein DD-endopeptidase MepM/ murein hydrolase activator NlpD